MEGRIFKMFRVLLGLPANYICIYYCFIIFYETFIMGGWKCIFQRGDAFRLFKKRKISKRRKSWEMMWEKGKQ